jgi:hypothetical protein
VGPPTRGRRLRWWWSPASDEARDGHLHPEGGERLRPVESGGAADVGIADGSVGGELSDDIIELVAVEPQAGRGSDML